MPTARPWIVGAAFLAWLCPLVGLASEPGRAPVPTTVFVVRHTEKAELPGDSDPPLSDAGRARAQALRRSLASVDLKAVYSTPFRRTRDTVAPAAADRGLPVREVDPGDMAALAARLRAEHPGEAVLVTGHSNTVPDLIRALGVETDLALDHRWDYDDLFIVTLEAGGGARMIHLHYGEPSDPPRE